MKSCLPNEKYSEMRAWSEQILSVVEYPLRNPAWFSFKISVWLENNVKHLFNMEVNSLPKQLTYVIALQISGSSGSSLFVYTGKIIPIDQLSGIIPLSNTKLKILQYILIITGDFR